MKQKLIVLSAAIVVATTSSAAFANAYASGITPYGSDGASFVLNENAASVALVLDGGGGGTYALPTTRGVHSFSLSDFGVMGAHSFSIEVTSSTAPGWTQIGVDEMSTSFYSPRGIAVNKNASSSLFGSVYVSNAAAGYTVFGRGCQDGIYTLNAAMQDLGFADGGVDWSGSYGPWKSTVGPDDHLYVCNYNDDTLYEMSGDFASAVQIIGPEDKFEGQFVSSVWVDGTQADGNRMVYAGSSNYPTYGVIRYALGSAAEADGPGETYISPDAYGFYPYDIAKDSDGDWYSIQYRWADAQAPNASKIDGSGTVPLGDDPLEILWDTEDQTGGGYCMDIFEEAGIVAVGFTGGETVTGVVRFYDMETGDFLSEFDPGMTYVRDLAFDAAGNLYVGDNSTEWVRVFSPGGDFEFATDGWFVIPEPASLVLLAFGAMALVRRR